MWLSEPCRDRAVLAGLGPSATRTGTGSPGPGGISGFSLSDFWLRVQGWVGCFLPESQGKLPGCNFLSGSLQQKLPEVQNKENRKLLLKQFMCAPRPDSFRQKHQQHHQTFNIGSSAWSTQPVAVQQSSGSPAPAAEPSISSRGAQHQSMLLGHFSNTCRLGHHHRKRWFSGGRLREGHSTLRSTHLFCCCAWQSLPQTVRIKPSTRQTFANQAQHTQIAEKASLAETPPTREWREGATLLQAPFLPKALHASSLG